MTLATVRGWDVAVGLAVDADGRAQVLAYDPRDDSSRSVVLFEGSVYAALAARQADGAAPESPAEA